MLLLQVARIDQLLGEGCGLWLAALGIQLRISHARSPMQVVEALHQGRVAPDLPSDPLRDVRTSSVVSSRASCLLHCGCPVDRPGPCLLHFSWQAQPFLIAPAIAGLVNVTWQPTGFQL